MKKFRLEDYEGYFAIHCQTVFEVEIFEEYINKKFNGNYNLKKRYSCYNENTCYRMQDNKRIAYAPVNFCLNHGWQVLEFDDFDWKED